MFVEKQCKFYGSIKLDRKWIMKNPLQVTREIFRVNFFLRIISWLYRIHNQTTYIHFSDESAGRLQDHVELQPVPAARRHHHLLLLLRLPHPQYARDPQHYRRHHRQQSVGLPAAAAAKITAAPAESVVNRRCNWHRRRRL